MWSDLKSSRSTYITGTRLSLSAFVRALLLVLSWDIPSPDACMGLLRVGSQYRICLMRGSPDFVAQYDLDMAGPSHEVIAAVHLPSRIMHHV